ncbi:circularly permuted type 2 ATP-grasp protein [Magnetospira thiophila]
MSVLENATDQYLAALLDGYRPPAGVADELLDSTGSIRPVWRRFANHLAHMSEQDITRHFARGDQHLRDAGVYYRQYGPEDESLRDWPLSHVPVLVDEKEWRQISAGLVQRAELLERVVADLYGPNELVAQGYLPASLIAASPEWLRPLVGVRPPSGHFLHFIAFEIGRGPDGTWWVLGDRTQAPSGAGFALENRVATRRVFNDIFSSSNVLRLSGFFRAFRDAMKHHWGDSENRVGILTPGPLNDTYFEHAYIARYLGFMLLEGEDLRVENGQLMVRTVEGLRPISVLWRRLDSVWTDPLELNEGSRLGTPGLLGAIRQGNVTLVNAIGAGVLETRAMLAFLPRISEFLLGQSLVLPNLATWWCGQEKEGAYVRANVDRMVIGRALSTNLPFERSDTTAIGGRLIGEGTGTLADHLQDCGAQFVGQEAVTLSTTPAHVDGRLVPRPMSLRVFLARTENGWQVMPGGFARIGRTEDPSAIAMQTGGSAADVWVVCDKPVDTSTMHPTSSGPYLRGEPGVLPSRAADNLLWLGRYVERAEGTIRLLRAYHARLAESGNPNMRLLQHLSNHMKVREVDPEDGLRKGLLQTLGAALNSGGNVRDRFSVDGWMALEDLGKTVRQMERNLEPGDDTARAMGVLLRKVTGFSGLVHENMYRFIGWHFLSIGRSLERALAMSQLLARFIDLKAPDGSLDLAIEVGDSVMVHRRLYPIEATRETVIDLLALDTKNPRAILFQLNELRENADQLPGAEIAGQMSPLTRAILKAQSSLAVSTPDTLGASSFHALGNQIAALSNDLTAAYLK